ncbi:protein of unknown function [Methylocella tundrae]|uniref:Uncharacterized protein n=1 Tax=Methylocella tundrae TaxID=227605 RepID=A0A4U8YWN1_METTU|nr:protein of unknown function [Methylocella tundrae]
MRSLKAMAAIQISRVCLFPVATNELNRNHYERFERSPGPKLMFTLHPSFALSHDLNA